jgi:hypothetical protein
VPKKPARLDPTHEQLLLLDRLEELREDMEELGISSLEQLRQRIVELEAQLDDDELDEDDDGPV